MSSPRPKSTLLTGPALRTRFGIKNLPFKKRVKFKVTKWKAQQIPLPKYEVEAEEGEKRRYDEIVPRTNNLGAIYLGTIANKAQEAYEGDQISQVDHILTQHQLQQPQYGKKGKLYILSINELSELAEEGEVQPEDWVKAGNARGIEVVHRNIAMPDFTPNIIPEAILAEVYQMRKFLQEDPNNTIYVHCKAGKARSANIVAAYLSIFGEDHGIVLEQKGHEEGVQERAEQIREQLGQIEEQLEDLTNPEKLEQMYKAEWAKIDQKREKLNTKITAFNNQKQTMSDENRAQALQELKQLRQEYETENETAVAALRVLAKKARQLSGPEYLQEKREQALRKLKLQQTELLQIKQKLENEAPDELLVSIENKLARLSNEINQVHAQLAEKNKMSKKQKVTAVYQQEYQALRDKLGRLEEATRRTLNDKKTLIDERTGTKENEPAPENPDEKGRWVENQKQRHRWVAEQYNRLRKSEDRSTDPLWREYHSKGKAFSKKKEAYWELDRRVREGQWTTSAFEKELLNKAAVLDRKRKSLEKELRNIERLGLENPNIISGASEVKSRRALSDLHEDKFFNLGSQNINQLFDIKKMGKLHKSETAIRLHHQLMDDLRRAGKKDPTLDDLMEEYNLYMKERRWADKTPVGKTYYSSLEFKNDISEKTSFKQLLILSLDKKLPKHYVEKIRKLVDDIYDATNNKWFEELVAWLEVENKKRGYGKNSATKKMFKQLNALKTDALQLGRQFIQDHPGADQHLTIGTQVSFTQSEALDTDTEVEVGHGMVANRSEDHELAGPAAFAVDNKLATNPTAAGLNLQYQTAETLETLLANSEIWKGSKRSLHPYKFEQENKNLTAPAKAMMKKIEKGRHDYNTDNTMATPLKQVIALALLESLSNKNSELERELYKQFADLIDVEQTLKSLNRELETSHFKVRRQMSKTTMEKGNESVPVPRHVKKAHDELHRLYIDEDQDDVYRIANVLKILKSDSSSKWKLHQLFRDKVRDEVTDSFYKNIERHLVLKEGKDLGKAMDKLSTWFLKVDALLAANDLSHEQAHLAMKKPTNKEQTAEKKLLGQVNR